MHFVSEIMVFNKLKKENYQRKLSAIQYAQHLLARHGFFYFINNPTCMLFGQENRQITAELLCWFLSENPLLIFDNDKILNFVTDKMRDINFKNQCRFEEEGIVRNIIVYRNWYTNFKAVQKIPVCQDNTVDVPETLDDYILLGVNKNAPLNQILADVEAIIRKEHTVVSKRDKLNTNNILTLQQHNILGYIDVMFYKKVFSDDSLTLAAIASVIYGDSNKESKIKTTVKKNYEEVMSKPYRYRLLDFLGKHRR